MNDADAKAFCARHGINTRTHTYEDGTTRVAIDEDGMRQLADLAPDPETAHALVDQWLAEADARHA